MSNIFNCIKALKICIYRDIIKVSIESHVLIFNFIYSFLNVVLIKKSKQGWTLKPVKITYITYK